MTKKKFTYSKMTFILSVIGFIGSVSFYLGVLKQVYATPDNIQVKSIELERENKQRELIKQGHFDNRVPGSVDPASDIMVNSDGTIPDQNTSGENLIERDAVVPTRTGGGGGGGGDANGGEPNVTLSDINDARTRDNERSPRGRTTELLRYPLMDPPPEFKFDYIKITAYDYVPSGLGDSIEVDKNLGSPAETIFLPMQPQISETNAVSWSDDQLNPIQKMLGEAAMGAIKSLGDLDLQGLGSAFSNLGKNAGEIFKDPLTKKFATAYFAGQAVGANLVGRTTGMVINPNLELLFNGPNLRTFQFNFRLTPRSQVESEEIRRIIRAFKRNMAVSRSTSNLFLLSPRIFKLKYIYKNGGEHPYLNKFKPCALSNFQVNYTPDGSYATFDETGSLTAYEITMDFTEVIPIYDTDIPTSETESMGY